MNSWVKISEKNKYRIFHGRRRATVWCSCREITRYVQLYRILDQVAMPKRSETRRNIMSNYVDLLTWIFQCQLIVGGFYYRVQVNGGSGDDKEKP